MKKSYKILAIARHVITLDAYNEEDATELAAQIPLTKWDDFVALDFEVLDVNPLDDYEDAPRDEWGATP
jgi:hypothetical protein